MYRSAAIFFFMIGVAEGVRTLDAWQEKSGALQGLIWTFLWLTLASYLWVAGKWARQIGLITSVIGMSGGVVLAFQEDYVLGSLLSVSFGVPFVILIRRKYRDKNAH